ncbi:MAG: porin family protein [Bacteroidales bacterium]|nr:porin family protein [Bacteroidales bacterium]
MKKMMIISTITLLFLSTVGKVTAQESRFGIKGGLNVSTLTTDEFDDKNLKPGFHIGIFNKVSLGEALAIQPELLFITKGAKYSYDNPLVEGDTKFNLNYIELPVKVVVNLLEIFEVQFGPYVGYLVSAKSETNAEVLNFWNIASEDEIDRKQFKAFDYGLSLGVGLDLDPLIVGINYNLGLTPVAEKNEISNNILGSAKNSVIQAYIGIKF